MSPKIKVSILCITYNQKNYIEQCLDSLLMQKTNYKFEILINDDASNDGTTEIIKKYQKKYPDIIRPVFHKKNQYSAGDMSLFVGNLFPLVNGEYLALCEGDDYWIDEYKLQKQSDFLDKNQEYTICFNRSKIIFENNEKKELYMPALDFKGAYSIEELLKSNFISTNSVMYKRQNYKNMRTDLLPQDLYMHLFHAQFGKIGFINEVMSVYRRHSEGIWWASHSNRMDEVYKKQHMMLAGFYDEMLNMFSETPKYKKIISSHLYFLISFFIEVEKKTKTNITESINKKYPSLVKEYIYEQNVRIDEQQNELYKLDEKRQELENDIKYLSEKIEKIYNTKSYKLAEKISSISKSVISKDKNVQKN